MKLDIRNELPPNYRAILEVLPEAAARGVIFAYAPAVYNPSAVVLTPALQAHEAVHLRQQGDDPAGWWERYLESVHFRFGAELEAHQVEYHWWRQWKPQCAADAKRMIATRLLSPLYGATDIMSFAEAERLLETRERLGD